MHLGFAAQVLERFQQSSVKANRQPVHMETAKSLSLPGTWLLMLQAAFVLPNHIGLLEAVYLDAEGNDLLRSLERS